MLLHNGVSFVAGIIVAAGVLMLLVALEWVIREACLGKKSNNNDDNGKRKGIEDNSSDGDDQNQSNDSRQKVVEKLREVVEAIYKYIKDRWTLGTADQSPKQTDANLDQLVVSVAICKLLLAWNSDSDWSLLPVRNNGIRVFFVLLYLLHLNSVFKGAAIVLDSVARDLKRFTELPSVVASLVVVSVLSSDAAYLLLNDEVSAFGLHSKAFASAIEDAILAAFFCSLAILTALALAYCLSSNTLMTMKQQQQQQPSRRPKRTGGGSVMRFTLLAALAYFFTVVTAVVPSAAVTYYTIQFFVIAAHVLERLLLF